LPRPSRNQIELIASENIVSRAVLEAQGSILTNKYAEGYPGRRYYGGCEYVDVAESWPSTGPSSCSARLRQRPAALRRPGQPGVFMALLKPGDTFMGMDLAAGGHLTHGAAGQPVGQVVQRRAYSVRQDDHTSTTTTSPSWRASTKPKLIIAGGSAYPRHIDFARFREIADSVGACSDGGHGALRRAWWPAGPIPIRCRTPMSSPPRRTRPCAGRAAAWS
jgi:glycine hydroxymethyltransferase